MRWIEGNAPKVAPTASDVAGELARDLAGVLAALRRLPVRPGARVDPALRCYRGEALTAADTTTHRYLGDCRTARAGPGPRLLPRVWGAAMTLPNAEDGAQVRWLHGDLLAENLRVADGRLTAVLDFGALAVDDPSVDLIVAWEVLEPSTRAVFRSLLQIDDATWLRGRAWALAIAVMTFPSYWPTMPERCTTRLAMAHAGLHDAASWYFSAVSTLPRSVGTSWMPVRVPSRR